MTLEQGERLLLTFIIPILGLILFSQTSIVSTGTSSRVEFFAPSALALAVMSTAMVNLAVATGFERSWGVLKRLGTTPLSPVALLAAKAVAVIVVEVVQTVVLLGIAFGLGWRPHAGAGAAVAAALLATMAFAGLGFLMAGTLRAEATLAVANGLYVVFLGISGIMFPLSRLGGFADLARLLPPTALADALHPALGTGQGVRQRPGSCSLPGQLSLPRSLPGGSASPRSDRAPSMDRWCLVSTPRLSARAAGPSS